MKNKLQILILLAFCISSCLHKSKTVVLPEINISELSEMRPVINFWKVFSQQFDAVDTLSIRKVVLDTIWLWGDRVSSDEFIKRYAAGYSKIEFSGITDTSKVHYSSIGCNSMPPIPDAIKQERSNSYNCIEVIISKDTVGSVVNGIEFSFLETTKGYRLWGLEYSGYYWDWPPGETMADTTTIQN